MLIYSHIFKLVHVRPYKGLRVVLLLSSVESRRETLYILIVKVIFVAIITHAKWVPRICTTLSHPCDSLKVIIFLIFLQAHIVELLLLVSSRIASCTDR